MITIKNIKLLSIGDIIWMYTNPCIITDKTNNSLRLFIKARTKFGIDSNDWYGVEQLKKYYIL